MASINCTTIKKYWGLGSSGLDQYLEIKEGGRERKRKEGRKEERKKGRRSAFPTGHVLEMRVGGKMIASLV